MKDFGKWEGQLPEFYKLCNIVELQIVELHNITDCRIADCGIIDCRIADHGIARLCGIRL